MRKMRIESDLGAIKRLSFIVFILVNFVFSGFSEARKLQSAPTRIEVRGSSGALIDSLVVGEWYEVPNSNLASVVPSTLVGGGRYSAIMDAWSGGAFDTQRDRLIVWGGGHGDYAGNEIYVFDLNTLKWTRLNEPSVVDPNIFEFTSGYYADGLPVARHTYNSIQYVPSPVDRFCTFGGDGFWKSGQYGGKFVDCFNFSTNKWETKKYDATPSASIGATTAFDSATGVMYQHGGSGNTGLSSLNFSTGKWSQQWEPYSNAGNLYGYYRTAEIDPINRKMISVGSGTMLVHDISKSGPNYAVTVSTSGPQDILNASNPGLVYVSDLKKMVAWRGGGNLYHLDLATMAWVSVPPVPTNKVVPSTATGTGIFGRFRYSPNKKVLVLVSSIYSNVFLMKVK